MSNLKTLEDMHWCQFPFTKMKLSVNNFISTSIHQDIVRETRKNNLNVFVNSALLAVGKLPVLWDYHEHLGDINLWTAVE